MHNRIFILSLLVVQSCVTTATLSIKNNWNDMSSEALLRRGRAFAAKNLKSDSAMMCLTIVSNRYYDGMNAREMEICAYAMSDLACLYTYGKLDYPQAYRYLIKAQTIAEDNGFERVSAIIDNNLGNLYAIYGNQFDRSGMKKKALALYRSSYRKAEQIGYDELQLSAFTNLFGEENNFPLKDFRGIFKTDISPNTSYARHARTLYKAIGAQRRGDYIRARTCFLHLPKTIDTRYAPESYIIGAYMRVANTYHIEGNHREATTWLLKARKLAVETSDIVSQIAVSRKLIDEYRHRNMATAADSCRMSYYTLKDSLSTAFGLNNIEEMDFRHDLQIAEDKSQQLMMEKRIHRILIYMGLLFLVSASVFMFILVRKNRKLKSSNRKLYENNLQLLKADEEQKALRKSYVAADRTADSKKYASSNLTEESKEQLFQNIQAIMDQSDWICRKEFSLNQLAQLVGSNKTYVSQVINEKYGVSFSILLGNNRIKEACRRINDEEQYGQYTLEGISESVGFKSKATFNSSFKRLIGLTPSEYQSMARLRKANQDRSDRG